uniref:Polymerase-associated protein n=1 Tax=Drosophila immigrans sigmavirus TaxID=1002360 RepID=A0A140D8L8_9RHAB|nr:polymerase-associated protein [Drosophila immigrans sigmavirus]
MDKSSKKESSALPKKVSKQHHNESTSTTTLETPQTSVYALAKEELLKITPVAVPEAFDTGFPGTYTPEDDEDEEDFRMLLSKYKKLTDTIVINGLEGAERDQEMLDGLYHVRMEMENTDETVQSPTPPGPTPEPSVCASLDLSSLDPVFCTKLAQFLYEFDMINSQKGPAEQLGLKVQQVENGGIFLAAAPRPNTVINPILLEPPCVKLPDVTPCNPQKMCPVADELVKRIEAELEKGFLWRHRLYGAKKTKRYNLESAGFTKCDIPGTLARHPEIVDGKTYMYAVLGEKNQLRLLRNQYILVP